MQTEEFDEQDVIDLVTSALAEDGGLALPQSERTLPLAFNEGRLLEMLSKKLTSYMANPDVQIILDDLRTELYSDLDIGNIKNLHSVTLNCRRCPAALPPPNIPQWNVLNPDAVFVVDQPLHGGEHVEILMAALKNAGWKSSRIMLTYVNRCTFKDKRRAETKEVQNCAPYLLSEIQIVRPKIRVPLGLLPTATLLNANVKLAEERGRVGWLGPWAILPTYSPGYVVKAAGSARTTFEQDIQLAYNFTYGEK